MTGLAIKRKTVVLFFEAAKHLLPLHTQNFGRMVYIRQEDGSDFLFRIAQQGSVFRVQ